MTVVPALEPSPPVPEFASDTRASWGGWGYDRPALGLLLAAAEEICAAAPWTIVGPDQPIHLDLPDQREWLLAVHGPSRGNEVPYLELFEDPGDYFTQTAAEFSLQTAWEGVVHTLAFETADQLSPVGHRELLACGWRRTRGAAWPQLFVGAPEGEPTVPLPAPVLAGVWRAALAFIRRERGSFTSRERLRAMVEWTDPATGISCMYEGVLLQEWDRPFPPADRLAPSLPEGPKARPAAALLTYDPDTLAVEMLAMVERFEAGLRAELRSERTVRLHAGNLERMAAMLASAGVPWTAITELDLRIFLYLDALGIGEGFSEAALDALPVSLERYFRFLAGAEGIICTWAAPVLADRESYHRQRTTRPVGDEDDPRYAQWVAPLLEDLVERALILPHPHWPEDLDPDGHALENEITRRCLLWREEIILAGTTDPHAVCTALAARATEWEHTPHPGFEGRTPLEVLGVAGR
ncbi:MAG: hypothetical protein SF070_08465 [Gemmatimonadota bacterium]|nr:hypothetical protein [Gemmatimonadota bacterium]